ncbi:hypothetical protein FGL86_02635 [Pistricoccus aurantiacus]|uniref:Metal-dependent hydrolase n=1 Tax=Pistricoccus aurantiacus TaxID=1883414 RepID=A0A5B8SUX1_9GAMM|nr:metal-dependent hydrolase [Pistricoccus aurantiacus]QEA40789.1 hypothetical protein FGL86_02635 [Pistricoccus aurantiacus]
MANFRVHIGVAAAGGALVSLAGCQIGLWSPLDALPIIVLVTFGGILPDVDSDHSRSIRLIFSLLAVLAVAAGALLLQDYLSVGALLLACGGLYLLVRYGAGPIFARFTVHRGIWHSLLAGTLCALIASAISYQLLAQEAELAWFHGLALLFGALIHLVLDEMYSVDLEGARLKRSFGTALKFFDYHKPLNSLLMLLMAGALFPWLPPWSTLVSVLQRSATMLH